MFTIWKKDKTYHVISYHYFPIYILLIMEKVRNNMQGLPSSVDIWAAAQGPQLVYTYRYLVYIY